MMEIKINDPRIALLVVWAIFFLACIALPSLCARTIQACFFSDWDSEDHALSASERERRTNYGAGAGGFHRSRGELYYFLSPVKREEIDKWRVEALRRCIGRFSLVLSRGHMMCLSSVDDDGSVGAGAGAGAGGGEIMKEDKEGNSVTGSSSSDAASDDSCKDTAVLTSSNECTNSEVDEEMGQKEEEDHHHQKQPSSSGRIEIVAPRGKLHLTFDNVSHSCTTQVTEVKEYSPLYGKIFVGDEMLSIDQMDVSQTNSQLVLMELEFREQNEQRRIVVWRRGGNSDMIYGHEEKEEKENNSIVPCYTHVQIPLPGFDVTGNKKKQLKEEEAVTQSSSSATTATTTMGSNTTTATNNRRRLVPRFFQTKLQAVDIEDNNNPTNPLPLEKEDDNHDVENSEHHPDNKHININNHTNESKNKTNGAPNSQHHHQQQQQTQRQQRQTQNRIVPAFCAICLDQYTPTQTISWSSNTECTHIFHQECIVNWLVALGRNKQQFQRFDRNELYPEDENDLDDVNGGGGDDGDDDHHRRPNDRSSSSRSRSRSRSTKKILNYPLECPCCRQDFVCETVVNLADDETDEHENDNNPNKKMVLLHGEEKEEEEKVEEPEMGLFDGNDDNV